MQAVNAQTQAIISGCGDVTIAAGGEDMSRYPMGYTVFGMEGAVYPVIDFE